MEEIAWGLKKSDFHFLWVVRDSENGKLPLEFTKEENNNSKGLIVTWCNQLEMLAHKAVGCFVTHCGWNSTLEGLCLGVPMVGVPKWSDQLTDAKFIEEIWGVGVRAKEDERGIVAREEIVRCLRHVMEGETSDEMRRNASKWRGLAKEAISAGGSSDEIVRCLRHVMEGETSDEMRKNASKWRGLAKEAISEGASDEMRRNASKWRGLAKERSVKEGVRTRLSFHNMPQATHDLFPCHNPSFILLSSNPNTPYLLYELSISKLVRPFWHSNHWNPKEQPFQR